MSMKERLDALRKGKDNIAKAKNEPVDANAVILGHYLRSYVPAGEFGPDVVIMTTDEIISALAEMADLEQAEVNRELAAIGYTPGRNDAGSFGWMMKPVSR